MKRIITRTTTAILLAISMLLALIGGLLFIKNEGKSASAATVTPTVSITADTDSFVADSEFTISVKVTAPGMKYRTVNLNLGIDFDSPNFDQTKMDLITMSEPLINPLVHDATNNRSCNNNSGEKNTASDGLYLISLANFGASFTIKAEGDTAEVFTAKIKILKDVAPETQFTFTVKTSRSNTIAVTNISDNTYTTYYGGGTSTPHFVTEPLVFKIKTPSTNAKLSEIKVGQGEETAANQYTTLGDDEDGIDSSNTLNYVADDPTAPLTVKVASVDSVKSITLKPGDVVVKDGEGEVTIPANGVITIEVLAEDGKTKETYTINVKIVGANLTALTAVSDSELAGVTVKDLQGTFASTTYEYDVKVPNDKNREVTVNATISTGNYAKTTVDLEYTGAATGPATANSATDFTVTGIESGNTLKITASADDGAGNTSEKVYTLTFSVVDTDTEFTYTVEGATTHKQFQNSTTKAAAETPAVDGYYMIVGESNAASLVKVTAPVSATVKVNGSNYPAAGASLNANNGNKHTITVTAEAGNSATATFILKNYIPLELEDGLETDFIFEEETEEDGENYYFRRTYKEMNIVHGVDDVDFEKLVLGEIRPATSVMDFVEFFKTTNIKLYDSLGDCIWDCGNPGAAVDDVEYYVDDLENGNYMPICTGWYIEYIVDNNVEETIYISVLGDLDGSGFIDTGDIAEVGRIIRSVAEASDYSLEARLAGYISNVGTLSADTITDIGAHLNRDPYVWVYYYTQV